MKILITTDLFATDTNGVVTSVRNLMDELQTRGHEVRILTLSESGHSYKKENVYYIRSMSLQRIYPNVRMPLSYRHRLIRELIEWKPDVIHSQCEFFSMQYALRIARKTDAPIVHTYHTLYEQYITYLLPSRRLGKKIVRIVSRKRLKRASRVIAPTGKVRDALVGYGVDNTITVIPSGISLSQHRKRITDEQRCIKRASLGINENQRVLVNLGRLGNEKNLGEIMELFAKAVSLGRDLILLIVGDGPAKAELERQAQMLQIADKVIFTGMVKPCEVQEYYQIGDIFVSASTSETQGLTYVEAAANGLPLLCRKDPCIDDVLIQGENGYAYTEEGEFLTYLDKMLADEGFLRSAGLQSEKVAASFDKGKFGEAIEKIYLSALGK